MVYDFFVVSYDLHLDKDYPKIKEAIERISVDWVKPLESFYLIKTHLRPKQIRDTLKESTDNDDSIFVIKADINNWASLRISKDVTDRIKEWS